MVAISSIYIKNQIYLCNIKSKLYNTMLLNKFGKCFINTNNRVLDRVASIENRARYIWERNKLFSVQPCEKKKFFTTFPYPYMNGTLHLGHAFSLTKCDFNAWYKRLCGFNVLFPFAYHCTGMPISAAAKRLKEEIQAYGNPPRFPTQANQRTSMFQYQIMCQLGIQKQKISNFTDAQFWIKFFPPLAKDHITKFGVHVDQNRSFVSTDLDPYYDSFIKWHFTLLKQKGYLKYGKRPSIFAPKDNQVCADHDRSVGEGVVPSEFTLLKLKITSLNNRLNKALEGKNVFVVSATKKPQLLTRLSACLINPQGEYVAIEMKNGQAFICNKQAARNLFYQHLTKNQDKLSYLDTFKGEEILGLSLSFAQVSQAIYILPSKSVPLNKQTGISACLPSQSQIDKINFENCIKDENLLKKYNINKDKIKRFQNPLLDNGVFLQGEYKGKKGEEVSLKIRRELIDNNQGLIYYEPEFKVVSRSGDQCVVSYCDQWYINYADEKWKSIVLKYINQKFKTNCDEVKNDLIYGVQWLNEWACSRTFGLGTRLPFDQKYVIQSLSDSTIYFAYYTISHLLQGDMYGSKPGILGITPDQLTNDFWSFVFLGKKYTSGIIPQWKLDKCRESFLYWYPLDLRCSGKDLIKNHLTMHLFHHAALWQDEKFWPKGYYCNGFVQVDGQKMSKSKGNFVTLEQAIADFGADAARIACAMAGDSFNDANFSRSNAKNAISLLQNLQNFFSSALKNKNQFRTSNSSSFALQTIDRQFQSSLQSKFKMVRESFQKMAYKPAIEQILIQFVKIRNEYIKKCGVNQPRRDLIEKYVYYQLAFLYPICPHFCEVSYIDYLLPFTENPQSYPSLLSHSDIFAEKQL